MEFAWVMPGSEIWTFGKRDSSIDATPAVRRGRGENYRMRSDLAMRKLDKQIH
jgi:hypothetical protein